MYLKIGNKKKNNNDVEKEDPSESKNTRKNPIMKVTGFVSSLAPCGRLTA